MQLRELAEDIVGASPCGVVAKWDPDAELWTVSVREEIGDVYVSLVQIDTRSRHLKTAVVAAAQRLAEARAG